MTARQSLPAGSLVALATPFRNGALDTQALSALVARQVGAGTAGLVVCGSTGEAGGLDASDHARVIACAVEAAAAIPVIAGCGAGPTETTVAFARAAARAGANGLLLAAPAYVKPSQAGICAHVRAATHACDLPVILYDVPSRVGVAIADVTVARLFEAGLIVALKDAAADLGRPPRLRALCGPGLAQYAGDDATACAHRAMGGVGCVSVTANVVPALCAALHLAWDEGRLAEMARLRDLLAPLHGVLFMESNPVPVKAALARLNLCTEELRLPLMRAEDATHAALRAVLATILPEEARASRQPLAIAS